jgi:two-component system response regulator
MKEQRFTSELKEQGPSMTMNESTPVILVVEDNPDHAELTLEVLSNVRVRHEIIVARDGAEALEYLLGDARLNSPLLVLLDLNLPKISGLDVLRRIRSKESTRLVPVVILTSSRNESDIIESYNLGANSYIVKPVDYEQFSVAVEQLGLYWLGLNIPPE